MNTKMKFFMALALTTGFVVSTNAQSVVSNTVNANATVQTPLIVTAVQPLQFGSVNNVVAQTKVVSFAGVASSSGGSVASTGVQQGIGKIERTGGVVIYKLSLPAAYLVNGASQLPIGSLTTAYSLVSSTDTKVTGAADPVTTYTSIPTGSSDIYVHIGATVTPSAATTLTGVHTGTVTISAEYN